MPGSDEEIVRSAQRPSGATCRRFIPSWLHVFCRTEKSTLTCTDLTLAGGLAGWRKPGNY